MFFIIYIVMIKKEHVAVVRTYVRKQLYRHQKLNI